MKKIALYFLSHFLRFIRFPAQYLAFLHDYNTFWSLSRKQRRFEMKFVDQYPCLTDKTHETPFEPHYIYHPAWAARVLKKINPKKHIDISSTLTFCSIVSAFIPIDFYDIRPANISLSGVQSKRGNLLSLPFASNSLESISCMHTIEHIGLGRYGDQLDPNGDLKAIQELIRVTKPGGSIIFVTPVGKSSIRYNAHRVYAYKDVLSYFNSCTLRECMLVPDDVFDRGIVYNPSVALVNRQLFGCGCFWFVKKKKEV